MSEINKIPNFLEEDFKSHLESPNNFRILFSGPFGVGKTYFLKEFFENNKKEYETFHLFPVNYHIASNEDIVKLLKYDILKLLVRKKLVDFDKIESSEWWKSAKGFGYDKFREILLSSALGFGEKWAEKAGFDFENIKKLYKDYKEIENSANEKNKEIKSFYEDISNEWFTFNQEEFLTKFIREIIKKQKDKLGKKFVLIIDDLDRLDPEHLFRVINVFAGFNDICEENGEHNKFGFDKVIFVADYDNLKSLYYKKYGQTTDFSGYIDKLFSIEVWEFSNEKVFDEFIDVWRSEIRGRGKEDNDQILFLIFFILFINKILSYRVIKDLKEKVKSKNWEKHINDLRISNTLDIELVSRICDYIFNDNFVSIVKRLANRPLMSIFSLKSGMDKSIKYNNLDNGIVNYWYYKNLTHLQGIEEVYKMFESHMIYIHIVNTNKRVNEEEAQKNLSYKSLPLGSIFKMGQNSQFEKVSKEEEKEFEKLPDKSYSFIVRSINHLFQLYLEVLGKN